MSKDKSLLSLRPLSGKATFGTEGAGATVAIEVLVLELPLVVFIEFVEGL